MDLNSLSVDELLTKRNSLRRQLSASTDLKELRIAVLGGSTTNELVGLFELLLLSDGFRPVFYQSDYGRFYDDAVHDPQALIDFKPDLVYVHTSCRNVQNAPPLSCTEAELASYVQTETARYAEIWDALERNVGCQVIQNNFEAPPYAILGNYDAIASGGLTRFLLQLNVSLSQEIAKRSKVILQDVHSISARLGLKQWFDWTRYFSYKLLLTPEAHLELARSFAATVSALYGKSRKVLVLDLDNTLWGGVIGDDGVDKIQIGRETPVAESYTAFQEYCLSLRNRGILLAVCSKNTEEIAKTGFEHPSSVLKLEHISCFKANWEPKHENILAIAQELNLGVDSFVFVDDNPAERSIVEAQVPGVAVPDVGSEVSKYAEIVEQGRYFESLSLSKEDLERAALYAENSQRAALERKFANYGEYLDSLEMVAEIDTFKPVYIERIAQLTNKTNQFNLTTRRYTLAEMESISTDSNYIGIYGRLIDRFGDNGLISIVLGRKDFEAPGGTLLLDLWLMSCRVLKRDMEVAMLDELVARAKQSGLARLIGYYLPTKKNGMVMEHYAGLGFEKTRMDADGTSEWTLDLAGYQPRNTHIRILETVNG
ncbi:FkbH-like protein [Silvibacterium bohemicum]|uniref:FkbH-like protein n=1 Tax=Silvibacterium bohemicum TaxID=1577686 RepID=A0A841JVN7_9BACT|nr:HAD-IIIC family phosphatase [Silvibacterium bohemicum]MBB6145210.1 FkbH-like protein [Silvibacterium bohemicum]